MKVSDNEFPSLLVKEGTAPASPASGDQRVFIDSADHHLKRKNSSGTVVDVEAGSGGGLADQGAFTYLDATDAAAPSAPASGHARIYSKAGRIYSRDSGGTEYGPFDAAGGGGASLADFRLAGVKDAPGDLALGAYGDEMEYTTRTALDAVWTEHNWPTDSDSTAIVPIPSGSSVLWRNYGSAGKKGVLERAATIPTNCEIAVLVSAYNSNTSMFGLGFTDSTGAGTGCSLYSGGTALAFTWGLTGWGYNSSGSSGESGIAGPWSDTPFWLALRKLGTAYRVRASRDGTTWTTAVASVTDSTTMTRIVIGQFWNNNSNEKNSPVIHRLVYGAPDLGLG